MEQILKVIEENQAQNQASITNQSVFIFDKRQDAEPTVRTNDSYQVICSNSVPTEKIQSLKEGLNKLGLELQFSQQLAHGEKISQYKDLHKVFSEQQTELNHQPGEVLLVDVWATWCGPCQKPMQHNQEMLEKNEDKWKGKVRIVAVSVDDEKQVIQQRVNSKGWTKIEHLTLLGWKGDHPLIQDFKVQGIPFVCLVDKEGRIDYTGHPSQTDLQKRINELLQKEVGQTEAKQQVNQGASNEEVVSAIKNVQPLQKALSKEVLENKFGKADLFSVSSRGQFSIVKGKLEKNETTIQVSTYENTPEIIQEFKDLLKDVDPNVYKLEENLVKFEQPPTIENAECAECKAKLSYPCYWCKWDANPNSLRCRDCVEKKPTEEDKHFSYSNNSVLLTGPYARVAVKNLGNNIQPKNIDEMHGHQFGCNGCGCCPDKIGEARYICLGCRSDPNYQGDYIDICPQCFSNYLKGDEQVTARLTENGHKENHPFLRVLYNVKGYYQF